MPKATDTLTPPAAPLVSGKDALAKLEINDQLAKLVGIPAAHPDAELIRTCLEHPEKIEAFCDDPRDGDDDNPLWVAYAASCDLIHDAKPHTSEGMLAKALAAKYEAVWPNDTDHYANCPAERWSWDLVSDLIRLNATPNPDAELIQVCAEYEALEGEIEALYVPEDIDGESGTLLGVIMDKMSPLLKRMEEIHAQTLAGIHARARVVAVCNPGGGFTWDDDETVPGRLLAVLLRDAIALGEVRS